jgi:AmmeMemoRadiSam system protein B
MSGPVRRSPIAGSWYPGHPAALRREVEEMLHAVPALPRHGRLAGLISPHAGLMYSGPVAAWGYSLLAGQPPATIVLAGPSHRGDFEGLAVYPEGAFETPLGACEIDAEVAARLLACGPPFVALPAAHRLEHSLEMQLPFLQVVAPRARIVPVLLGTQETGEHHALAAGLAAVARDRPDLLLVASSDLSHYQSATVAERLDGQVLAALESADGTAFERLWEGDPHHACGGGAVAALLRALGAGRDARCEVLRRADSGDAGLFDKSRVVGYVSVAVWAAA